MKANESKYYHLSVDVAGAIRNLRMARFQLFNIPNDVALKELEEMQKNGIEVFANCNKKGGCKGHIE